jgi:hypothetical protein
MARGTLRLLRDALPDRTYRAENLVPRDAARALNASRDAKVLIEALEGLLLYNPALATSAVRAFKRKLVQSHRREQRATRSGGRGIAKSRLMLNAAHRTCAGWPVLDEDWTVVRRG